MLWTLLSLGRDIKDGPNYVDIYFLCGLTNIVDLRHMGCTCLFILFVTIRLITDDPLTSSKEGTDRITSLRFAPNCLDS